MRNKTGSNLAEYAIATAVVGMAFGMGLYLIFKDEAIVKNIEASLFGKKVGTQLIIDSSGASTSKINPGDLGGQPDNPKMQCSFNSCTIDFGSYVLTGVPENFGNVTTASRGGDLTDTYANMLEQLASQLEETNPTQADILKKMAEQARLMADVEIYSDTEMRKLNDLQNEMAQNTGTNFQKVADTLSTIDPNNLKSGDDLKLLASTAFLQKVGLLTQTQAEGYAVIILSIKNDYPNLQQWQKDFLNGVASAPDQIMSLYNTAISNLSASEQTAILNKNKNLYNIVTNQLDTLTGLVDSTSSSGPGKEFNDLLTNELPSAGLSTDMFNLVNFVGSQVKTTGDSIETQETIIVNPITTVNLIIPNSAGIQTDIAASIIETAGS